MRYLIIAIALTGCWWPNHKTANGDDAPAAKKETYTEAVQRYEATVAGLSETVGNTNAELSAIEQRLGSVEKKLGAIESLLSADNEISIEVPKAADVCVPAPPVKADAAPIENTRTVGPTLNGKPLDVAATIKASYRRMWSFPGSIDSHLAEHGVAGTAGLDYETKRKLHSALHEMGIAPKAVVKERVVVKAPIVLPQQSCPNGQCPNVRSYGYSTGRSRLFGWRR